MNQSILAASVYAKIRLPSRPQIAPWAVVVDLGDDRMQLRSAQSSFTLKGRLFIDVFHTVRQLLDGQHTLDEISGGVPTDVRPTTAIFLLQMLHANGLLQDATVPAGFEAKDLAPWDRQLRFFAHFVSNPATVQAKLLRSRLALFGTSETKSAIRMAAEALGICQVTDLGESPDELSGSATEADDRLDGVDFLIVGLEGPGVTVFDAVNAMCLQRGIRWMRAAVEGTTALLGPTIVPHQTACYTCYDQRLRSHLSDVEAFLAYQRQLAELQPAIDEGAIAPLRSVLAAQAVLEAARILTGFAPPATIGRFHELTALSPESRGHTVLRIPRCPSCGRRTPDHEVWERALQP